MKEVINKAARLAEKNQPFAFVTIVESNGSAPRHQAKMLVERGGEITGTIGGGPLEVQVIGKAREAIRQNRSQLFKYTLDMAQRDGLPMLCGGDVLLFIEVMGAVPELVLVGAGHVGLAVSRQCDLLGYPYRVVDEREELQDRYPRALSYHTGPTIREALKSVVIGSNSYVAIFTSNDDESALEEVIKHDCPYMGMIGSAKKITAVLAHLKERGVPGEKLKQVHSPIGLPIKAETPEEIAVSVLAEIIKKYRSLD
ncbi:MAG: XdhC/CoxI family protein [Spirochaetales bacterium]|nr:XdhC/CoxI family protein [Spirochaetales bacterium]